MYIVVIATELVPIIGDMGSELLVFWKLTVSAGLVLICNDVL